MARSLSHLDETGAARMVDVGDKPATRREARAEAFLHASAATIRAALAGTAAKGDVIAAARIAGIMAAKRTAELIPLCHPLAITSASVDIAVAAEDALRVEARIAVAGQTGVEMEALTAVSVACLTLYDMLKAIDKTMSIDGIRLLAKTGGRSGDFSAGS